MTYRLDVFGQTDVGRVRSNNEDQFFIADLEKLLHIHGGTLTDEADMVVFGNQTGHLLLVADGMGGLEAGETASRLASETTVRYLTQMMPWFYGLAANNEDDLMEELEAMVRRCQRVVHERGQEEESRMMGTTLTAAYVVGPRAYLVHVGDSRCYQFRAGEMVQLTTDHTLAQQLVEQGILDESQLAKSQHRHMLWNAIGAGSEEVDPEVMKTTVLPGDTLLLCTDGLTGEVPDDAILEVLASRDTAQEKCEELVAAARQAGGSDNITAIVAQFTPLR